MNTTKLTVTRHVHPQDLLSPRLLVWLFSPRQRVQLNKSHASFEEVSCGDYHTCAVNEDGDVECWGDAMQAEIVPDGFQAA